MFIKNIPHYTSYKFFNLMNEYVKFTQSALLKN